MLCVPVVSFANETPTAAPAKAASDKSAQTAKRRFDLPADTAEKALKAFSAQAGVEVLFSSEAAAGVKTRPVKGEFTPLEAAHLMLDGTALCVRDEKNGVVRIAKDIDPNAQRAIADSRARPSQGERSKEEAEKVVNLATFEVFGRKTLNMDLRRSRDDAQPYVVYQHETISGSGARDLEEFLKQRLPMSTSAGTNSQQASLFGTRSQVNLRGLGIGQTLILIDGHRAANSVYLGQIVQQTDLNGIPMEAVERIEVLPSTASGIYGGAATGGVVNVILRKDYAGAEMKITYSNSFDTDSPNRKVDFSAGMNFDGGRTNLLLAASFSDDAGLLIQDRDFIKRGRSRILANNPAAILSATNPPLGALPNLRSVNGSPLFGPGTPNFATIPTGYAGGGGIAPILTMAGQYNLGLANNTEPQAALAGLLSNPTRKSVTATLRRQFNDWLQAFVEADWSDNRGAFPQGNGTTSFTVGATAPNNPFGQAVRVTVPLSGVNSSWNTDVRDLRFVTGVIVRLPREWQASADYTRDRFRHTANFPNAPTAAAVSAIANGTIDILRDTDRFPIDFSTLMKPATVQSPSFTTLDDSALRLAGPLWHLPGGDPVLSCLAEYREEHYHQFTVFNGSTGATNILPARSQRIMSYYSEVKVPVVSEANRRAGIEELELQLAGRFDRYRINGTTASVASTATSSIVYASSQVSSSNPTIGVRYKPVKDLIVRASYGTGFLPPAVSQLTPNIPNSGLIVAAQVDRRRGNTSTTVPLAGVSGGNPNLTAEKSESWSSGLVYTPQGVSGLRISLDWTNIKKTNNITSLGIQLLLDNESLFPGRVIRGANLPGDPPGWAGPVTFMDITSMNIASAEVEAYDAAIDYHLPTTNAGTFDFFAAATWNTHFRSQLIAGQPVLENAGIQGNSAVGIPLKFKLNGGLTWKRGAWSTSWFAQYYNSYVASTNATNLLNQGNGGRVPSQIYHDIFASYAFPRSGGVDKGAQRWLRDTELQVGIRNVFNAVPPFDAGNTGMLYSWLGDARLRTYTISVKRRF